MSESIHDLNIQLGEVLREILRAGNAGNPLGPLVLRAELLRVKMARRERELWEAIGDGCGGADDCMCIRCRHAEGVL